MASPTVGTAAKTDVSPANTSHVINMPTLVAGELVLAIMSKDGSADDATWPGDWTYIDDYRVSATTARHYLYYKFASGSDSLTITTTASERSATIVIPISGAHATQAPEAGTFSTADDATVANPPSVTVSWATGEDNLFVCVMIVNESSNSVAIPTNYGNLNEISQTGSGEVQCATCDRALTADSDDPGTWEWNGVDKWAANTIVVRPAAAGPDEGEIQAVMQQLIIPTPGIIVPVPY